MAREQKTKPLFLRMASDKILYLSSGAASHLSERVNLYRRGNVTALVSAADGQYHLCRKSDACKGKNLCCAEFVTWLCQTYQLSVGAKLTAWIPSGEGGLLFLGKGLTADESHYVFDERFEPLALLYRKRYGERVYVEDNCISFTAGLRHQLSQRMGLYRTAKTFALLAEDNGPYRVEYRGDRKQEAIYSAQLATYLRKEFGCNGRSVLLAARGIKNGFIFGLDEHKLLSSPLQLLDLGAPDDCFLRLIKNGSLYFSSKAIDRLGETLSLYSNGQLLALRQNADGNLRLRRTGYQNLLHSVETRQLIQNHYPNCSKLYLTALGDLFLLSPNPNCDKHPSPADFYPLDAQKVPLPKAVKRQTVSSHSREPLNKSHHGGFNQSFPSDK